MRDRLVARSVPGQEVRQGRSVAGLIASARPLVPAARATLRLRTTCDGKSIRVTL